MGVFVSYWCWGSAICRPQTFLLALFINFRPSLFLIVLLLFAAACWGSHYRSFLGYILGQAGMHYLFFIVIPHNISLCCPSVCRSRLGEASVIFLHCFEIELWGSGPPGYSSWPPFYFSIVLFGPFRWEAYEMSTCCLVHKNTAWIWAQCDEFFRFSMSSYSFPLWCPFQLSSAFSSDYLFPSGLCSMPHIIGKTVLRERSNFKIYCHCTWLDCFPLVLIRGSQVSRFRSAWEPLHNCLLKIFRAPSLDKWSIKFSHFLFPSYFLRNSFFFFIGFFTSADSLTTGGYQLKNFCWEKKFS